MPTYYARGITINLGVQPLQDTITSKIVLKKGEVAKHQCERAEKQLLESETLQEQRVDYGKENGGYELHWLTDVPFMQSQAGHKLFEEYQFTTFDAHKTAVNPNQILRQTELESRYVNTRAPLALSLHVKLSDKSFRSGFGSENKAHLKVDVFFNGHLSSCTLIPTHDIRSGTKSMHQVYAGYRTDFLAERPWVLLPPGVGADGMPQKKGNLISARERWNDISASLLEEASHRGTASDGDIPPTAAFLIALSAMSMPQQVGKMHDRDGRSFGVIDVVITAGEGRKVTSGTTYLKHPQRLSDPTYSRRTGISDSSQDADGQSDDNIARQSDGVQKELNVDDLRKLRPVKRRAVQFQPSTSPTHNQSHFQEMSNSYPQAAVAPALTSPASMYLPGSDDQFMPIQRSSISARHDHPQKLDKSLLRPETPNTDDFTPPLQPPSLLSSNTSQLFPVTDRQHFSDPLHRQTSGDVPSTSVLSPVLCTLPNHLELSHDRPSPRPPLYNPTAFPEATSTPYASRSTIYPDLDPLSSLNPITPYHVQPSSMTGSTVGSMVDQAASRFDGMSHGLPMLPGAGYTPSLPYATSPFSQLYPDYAAAKPPVGLFSVTTKPRRSPSSVKKLLEEQSGQVKSDLSISRLVIRGQGGFIVIDYRWKLPQKIKGDHSASVSSADNTPDIKAQTMVDNMQKSISSELLQSRPASTSILGVHGPKAPPIIFEDPEEIMRKEKRKRSLKKTETSALPATPVSFDSKAAMEESNTSDTVLSSSPLSSLTNTPEPQEDLDGSTTIAQMDGTSEHQSMEAIPLAMRTPSPRQSKLGDVPALRSRAQSVAIPSPSSNTKKRKLGGATLPKQPRSPNRLKTTNNPLYNQGCVIAFAESADKCEEQGVLRQVKGERQGIFSEEYVVFATRYFIPGN